ncbi:MAG: 50S ribosomal protein L17, partial [Jatrophihabitantaceae bacterium]
IKGNASSKLYHRPGTQFYDSTVAEVWFATDEAAEKARGTKLAPMKAPTGRTAEIAEDAAAESATAAKVADEAAEAKAAEATDAEAPHGEGSHAPLEDGSQPDGFPIKGNASSKLYHVPDSPFYDRTVAEVWFADTEAAEAAGYQLPPSQREDDEDAAEQE